MKRIDKITIIGVGLIGGSIGLAVKEKGLARKVVGVGRRQSSMEKALKLKTIDEATLDPAAGVEGADIVVLATPILSMPGLVKRIASRLKRGSVITDVGSTKLKIVEAIEKILPKKVNFVGGHPMAGSEKKGVEEAKADLFRDSICILTKKRGTKSEALKIIKDLWSALGAKVICLSPEAHDRVVSEVSHLPHMVIFSMLSGIDAGSLRFASSGLIDTTRIASSDAGLWRDITISNKNKILKSLVNFKKNLFLLEKAIRDEDAAALLRMFKKAKKKRDMFIRRV